MGVIRHGSQGPSVARPSAGSRGTAPPGPAPAPGTAPAPSPGAGPGTDLDARLDTQLADAVGSTGATAGVLFLLEESEPVLRMVATYGMPHAFGMPWRRVPLTSPVPVTDALTENRLVWMGTQEDLARSYPRTAAALPYRFGLSAAPIAGERRGHGSLLLLWPARHPRQCTRRERRAIATHARRMARLLDAGPGGATLPEEPRTVPARAARNRPDPAAIEAAQWTERLPEGAVGLDLEARITFCTAAAARLLDRREDELLGLRLWEALPWLADPAHEDAYTGAVASRDPAAFTALRPPHTWLTFELHADATGTSVRVIPGKAPRDGARPGPGPTPAGPAPPGPAAAGPPGPPVPAAPAAVGEAAPDDASLRAAPAGRLYQLINLAATLTEAVGVRDVVRLIADQVVPALGAQGLVLSGVDAGRLRVAGHRGYDAAAIRRLDGQWMDAALTPAGHTLAQGLPTFVDDPRAMTAGDGAHAPHLADKQAWAFLPLLVSGRLIGCCVLSYDRPHTFSGDERAVLTSLAGLIAQALDRARLYDAKNDLAHRLQQVLLPGALPRVAGLDVAARYLPGGYGLDIGGDFYDLIRLTDTTAAVAIGDVQGHDAAAAALMGQARAAVRTLAGSRPDLVLARANQVLSGLEPDLLVSCLYAHLDLDRRRVTLASAGHPPPLLRHPDHRAQPLAPEPGPLLGTSADARYPSITAPLPDGAVLAFYTDGLVEVPGHGSDATTTRLADHLARHGDAGLDDLADALIQSAWPIDRPTDDIALLLLRALGPAG